MTQDVALAFARRIYRVTLDFCTIGEIEDEVGSVCALFTRLSGDAWTAGELVTVCHILLAGAGCQCDYIALGQDMVAQGFERYRRAVLCLLAGVLQTTDGG